MQDTNIIVFITTYNNVDEIDQTLESIEKQDYPREQVWKYIVDFGSTDGTWEKVLRYDRYHTGVFQLRDAHDVYNDNARKSRAIEVVLRELVPAAFQHLVSLQPGDILYDTCFSTCAQTLKKYRAQGITLLTCEADVLERDGNIRRQIPIVDRELLVDCRKDRDLLLGGYFNHYMGFFGGNFFAHYHRYYCLGNERCFWNNTLFSLGFRKEFVYSPQTLFCQKERIYRDEVEELLLRWEGLISDQRLWKGMSGGEADWETAKVNRNLANYGLWRLTKRYPDLTAKEREDLLYLADIIDPQIAKTEIYRELQAHIAQGLEIKFADYESYFDKECRRGREEFRATINASAALGVSG